MLMLFVFLATAAAAAGCSDTCTHPGVKVIELEDDDTLQDCSGYGPGLSTPATADECKEAMLATKQYTQGGLNARFTEIAPDDTTFDVCGDDTGPGFMRGIGTESHVKPFVAVQFCKCSACPPASSSSTGTGWTLTGIALGVASAGGPIAYGAARAS